MRGASGYKKWLVCGVYIGLGDSLNGLTCVIITVGKNKHHRETQKGGKYQL